MNESNKDKAIFSVGLLAALLAFGPFRTDFQQIILFGQPNKPQLSLLGVLLFFTFLLAVSVYLFALDYVKYGFNLKVQNHFIFKAISFLANTTYLVAIFFPLLIVIMAIMSIPPINAFALKYRNGMLIFDVVGGGIYLIFIVWNTIEKIKKTKQEKVLVAENKENDALENATKLFRENYFAESILNSYKVLEFGLIKQLLKEGAIIPPRTPFREIRNLAIARNVLTEKLKANLDDLAQIRNRAAHENVPITKEQAEFALNVVREALRTNEDKSDPKKKSTADKD